MMEIEVFDPPMCCPTGICGPDVDPVLPRFAADLEWLKRQGVRVTRYNLSQQPAAFAEHAIVQKALREKGNDCLPLILMDEKVISSGAYPERDALRAMIPGLSASTQAGQQLENTSCCGGAGCC